MKKTFEQCFRELTGGHFESPIDFPLHEVFDVTGICDNFGCSEHCESCWTKHPMDEKSLKEISLKPDIEKILANLDKRRMNEKLYIDEECRKWHED